MPALQAGGWLRLGPLGTIGSALPNGLALQLAHPGQRVVTITGDGALGFYLAEMDTAVRHTLPIDAPAIPGYQPSRLYLHAPKVPGVFDG